MPIITVGIAETRGAIALEDPDDDQASHNGYKKLQGQSGILLAAEIQTFLDEFKKERKDKLCIWIHGPYHYLPFQLLPL